MTKFILVRHGETTWNSDGRYQGQTDVPLSETGLRQAECLADNFNYYGTPSVIYSSDLIRARVTAEKIAAKFNLPVIPEPAFREINFGEWEGLSYNEICSRWPEESENFFRAPDKMIIPGGETVSALQQRTISALKRIAVAHQGSEILIVAHGAALRSIISYALHIPLQFFWSLRQYNTAVSIVANSDDRWWAELINCTAHLGSSFTPGKI